MILSSHSRINIPPETWYLIPLTEQLPLTATLSKEQVDRAVEIMTTHYRWPDLGIPKGYLAAWAKKLHAPRLREILDLVYDFHTKVVTKKIRWGDKTPPYIQILPQLSTLYPEARFIHLIRDGRDVTNSFRKLGWNGPALSGYADEWKRSCDYRVRYKSSGFAFKILDLKYEDLVLDMEYATYRVCDFLGENFEPQMLHWHEGVDEKIPKREKHIHTKLYNKSMPSDVNRWKKELSRLEILIIEAFIGRELRSCGYSLKHQGSMWALFFPVVRFLYSTITSAWFTALRGLRSLSPRFTHKDQR